LGNPVTAVGNNPTASRAGASSVSTEMGAETGPLSTGGSNTGCPMSIVTVGVWSSHSIADKGAFWAMAAPAKKAKPMAKGVLAVIATLQCNGDTDFFLRRRKVGAKDWAEIGVSHKSDSGQYDQHNKKAEESAHGLPQLSLPVFSNL
jgi:hypothetical protein